MNSRHLRPSGAAMRAHAHVDGLFHMPCHAPSLPNTAHTSRSAFYAPGPRHPAAAAPRAGCGTMVDLAKELGFVTGDALCYINGRRYDLPPGRAEVTLLTFLRGAFSAEAG
eukprot:366469-Chlamydomonas_euryale.AAC.4